MKTEIATRWRSQKKIDYRKQIDRQTDKKTDNYQTKHLLSGLSTVGVPENLKNSSLPFHYNNFDELLSIVDNHNIGVIKMEVMRNFGPENNFLKNVRKLATERLHEDSRKMYKNHQFAY